MTVKKWRFNIKLVIRDEHGHERTIGELTDDAWETLVDAFSCGTYSGDLEIEDDSDEWEDMNRGDEIRDYRKNDT